MLLRRKRFRSLFDPEQLGRRYRLMATGEYHNSNGVQTYRERQMVSLWLLRARLPADISPLTIEQILPYA
jgi:hypothetical protein